MQSTINQCDSSCSNVQQLIAGAILSWLWLMIDIDVDVHITWGHWDLTGMRCSQGLQTNRSGLVHVHVM